MTTQDHKQAAKLLAGRADEVGRASGAEPWLAVLRRISRGRLGQRKGWVQVPELGTPWQDTVCAERTGWRTRAANLDDEFVFAVDYQVCRHCRLGWVEQPHTLPDYQGSGLASAGLAALRTEHPGLSWHTLGGHLTESRAFWLSVGTGVPGEYEQLPLCRHAELSW